MKHNKTRFSYVLYSNKTWVFDQSEHAQGPIYITTDDNVVIVSNNETNTYISHIMKTCILPSTNVSVCC